MGSRAVRADATAERVRANVKRLREEQRLTLGGLADRLAEVGRPILATGVSKIEQGDRRVDVDDLVALALALDVNPNALLMPAAADRTKTKLTEEVTATAEQVWSWAAGDSALARWLPSGKLGGLRDDRGSYDLSTISRWFELTKPHRSTEELGTEVMAVFMHRQKAAKKGHDDGQR